ncbi:MAG: hypothetical protein IKH61_09855 [Bacteroidales bacterium]|nr:hypothetical protein [Bacteroidales bacterium]
MKKQKDIFCDLGFLKNLSCKLSNAKMSPDLEECKRNQTLIDWYDLICRSNMYVDCSVADFDNASKEDLYIKTIWKRSTDGRGKMELSQGSINKMCKGPAEMDVGMYNSLFLSESNHCEEAKRVGVINICDKELFDHNELFSDQGDAIWQSQTTNWNEILQSTNVPHNCNSMIFVDNYIFNQTERNLYMILDALLPRKIETTFYLTIFSENEGDEVFFENKKRALKEKLQRIRPDLPMYIEVFENNKSDFHDRSIITNYMWVGIGSGFDLFRRQGSDKSTELHVVYPMIVSEERVKWSNERYHILISDAKKCLRTRNKSSKNRLLR